MSEVEEDFDFMSMDEEGLTKCKASREVCPAPMSCKRRGPRAKEPAMNLRTIGEPHNDCLFYVQHEMIGDEKHIFRGKGRRHNKHAPSRGPDLMVKRHIKSGRNIND